MAKRTDTGEFQLLSEKVERFADERDWAQFHSPKNLSMALTVECAELMEHFQWLTESQSRKLNRRTRAVVSKELADIQIYLIRFSQVLGVDLMSASSSKLVENGRKYPVEKAKGSARKYTEYK